MPLLANHKENLKTALPYLQSYLQSVEYQEDMEKRVAREKLYKDLLSQDNLQQLNELDFGQVISPLFASQMWGDKNRLVHSIVDENGMDTIKQSLESALYGSRPIETRFNQFCGAVHRMGAAMLSEILAFLHPTQFAIYNGIPRKALEQLGFKTTLPFITKGQISGAEYQQYNRAVMEIAAELNSLGLGQFDLLDLNYLLFVINREDIVFAQPQP